MEYSKKLKVGLFSPGVLLLFSFLCYSCVSGWESTKLPTKKTQIIQVQTQIPQIPSITPQQEAENDLREAENDLKEAEDDLREAESDLKKITELLKRERLVNKTLIITSTVVGGVAILSLGALLGIFTNGAIERRQK